MPGWRKPETDAGENHKNEEWGIVNCRRKRGSNRAAGPVPWKENARLEGSR
jgi:hypothetical protein